MRIKKEVLKSLLEKVMIGVGNNKIIPITNALGIKKFDNHLTLCGTDGANYVYTTKELNFDGEDANTEIDICVEASLFDRLISKITTDEIELELDKKTLKVTGNGNYTLPLMTNENGGLLSFPNKEVEDGATEEVIDAQKIRNLRLYNEKALSKNPENVALNGYYVNNEVAVSTDRLVMSEVKENYLNQPMVLRKSFVDLLTTLNGDIIISRWNNNIYATNGETEIYSSENCEVDKFPIEKLQKAMSSFEFPYTATISLKDLSSALDRLSIFVTEGSYLLLNVKNGYLYVEESSTKANELIKLEGVDEAEWSGKIDITFLTEQTRSFKNDNANLSFGNERAIRFNENNVSKIICLRN